VTVEWRPAISYGTLNINGYKVFVNSRLHATLTPDQTSYTITKGVPCDNFTVYVQALSTNKNVSSPMSRIVQFTWPGIRPGKFRRTGDGQGGLITFHWQHPKLEDPSEKIIQFRVGVHVMCSNCVHTMNMFIVVQEETMAIVLVFHFVDLFGKYIDKCCPFTWPI
jgi:hypothetical protein